MTTLSRPTWFVPRECTLALRKSGLQFVSPFNGTMQAVETLAERWVLNLAMAGAADGGARSAFFNQWAGGVNLVPLHHFGRPAPLGTLRGAPTLASATARGGATLQLATCVGTNRVLNGSFEVDTNADGLADGWSRYSAGTVGTLSQARSGAVVWAGSYSQQLSATSLGTTSDDRQGITGPLAAIGSIAGSSAVVSCRLLGNASTKANMEVYWRDGGGTIIGSIIAGPLTLTGVEQSLSATGSCPAGTASADVYVYQHSCPGGSVALYVDLVRVEPGTTVGSGGEATLLAGDMLGDGTQLYQVAEDCTATDAGTMAVAVVNRSRGVVASGTTVLWDRPTALFMLPAMEQSTTWLRGGQVDGIVLDAVEVY